METVSSRQVQVDRYLKAAMIGTVAVLFYPLIHAVWAIFGINMATDPAHNEPDIDFIRRFAVPVTLGAFFVGFHVKRLRGAF